MDRNVLERSGAVLDCENPGGQVRPVAHTASP
jgi:hypothetical protein